MTSSVISNNHSYPFQFGLVPLQWDPYYGNQGGNRQQRQTFAKPFIPFDWTNNAAWKQNFLDYSA